MTIAQAMRWVGREIASVAGEDATADARTFVCAAARISTSQLLSRLHEPLQGRQEDSLREMIARRNRREPAQYIVGSASFLGLELRCDQRALVPRFETELLAMEAQRLIMRYGLAHVLDLCTGSGCIAIYLAMLGLKVDACDFSEDAMMLARENAREQKTDVAFYQGDLFEPLPEGIQYDMIVSNPPYVRSGDLAHLQAEVSGHEPFLALDGGADGLLFYRRIAREAPLYLRPGGWLALEIGQGQVQEVSNLLGENFDQIEALEDMRGIPRVVRARRRESDA